MCLIQGQLVLARHRVSTECQRIDASQYQKKLKFPVHFLGASRSFRRTSIFLFSDSAFLMPVSLGIEFLDYFFRSDRRAGNRLVGLSYMEWEMRQWTREIRRRTQTAES